MLWEKMGDSKTIGVSERDLDAPILGIQISPAKIKTFALLRFDWVILHPHGSGGTIQREQAHGWVCTVVLVSLVTFFLLLGGA